MRKKGKFVSFEGIDGCGKSTLLEELSAYLDLHSIPHIKTREPGGTRLGEKIREILLDPSFTSLTTHAETLLYTASRAQLVSEVIRPALDSGKWVLADRYLDATLAYQGYGRGLDLEVLKTFQEWSTGGLMPHYTVLLDCPVEIAAVRLKTRKAHGDRIEQEGLAFQEKVRKGYLELASRSPERIVVVEASGELEEVLHNFRRTVFPLFFPETSYKDVQ